MFSNKKSCLHCKCVHYRNFDQESDFSSEFVLYVATPLLHSIPLFMFQSDASKYLTTGAQYLTAGQNKSFDPSNNKFSVNNKLNDQM